LCWALTRPQFAPSDIINWFSRADDRAVAEAQVQHCVSADLLCVLCCVSIVQHLLNRVLCLQQRCCRRPTGDAVGQPDGVSGRVVAVLVAASAAVPYTHAAAYP
jgi:hypothetical protein